MKIEKIMSITLKILVILILGIVAWFMTREIIKTAINIRILLLKGRFCDKSRMRNGVVFNKKTNKLEADQSAILPF